MSTDEWANWIAAGALALSAIAYARSEVAARGSAKRAAQADAAAEKSASAAERSAAALERMSEDWRESLSRQEKRDRRMFSSGGPPGAWERRDMGGPWSGPPPGSPSELAVHWTVDLVKGRQHILKNIGRATAYDVEVTSENAARFDGPDRRDLQMGEGVDFLAIGSMQTGTPELVVTWSDTPDGERREWRRPLP